MPPSRQYTLFFGEIGQRLHEFCSSDDEESLVNIMVARANSEYSSLGDRFEIRDNYGDVLHRIDITLIYTVNPTDDPESE